MEGGYYICPQCSAKYTSKKNLKRHIRGKHDLDLNCEFCGAHFQREDYIRDHYRRAHPHKIPDHVVSHMLRTHGNNLGPLAREEERAILCQCSLVL